MSLLLQVSSCLRKKSCAECSYIPRLSDAVLSKILGYACVTLQDVVNHRLVCKRFLRLSEQLSLWEDLYICAGLDHAFGPPSWHSTAFLQERVKLAHRINNNLGSKSPKFTHHVHRLRYNQDLTRPFQVVHGRFLFFFTPERSLVCLDMATNFREIWEHRIPNQCWNTLRVQHCNIRHTEEPGRSVMSLLVNFLNPIVLRIYLDVIHESPYSVRLFETDFEMISLPFDYVSRWQQDWFVNSISPRLTVFNSVTSRVYKPDTPENHTIEATSFIGTDHLLASFQARDPGAGVLEIYALPTSDTTETGSEALSILHRIDTGRIPRFFKEIIPPSYQNHKNGTLGYPLTSFLVAYEWKKEIGSHVLKVIQLSILRQQDNDDCRVTIKDVRYAQAQPVIGEVISQYHSWVVGSSMDREAAQAQEELIFTRVKYSRDSGINFGTPVCVPIGLADSSILAHSFDEFSGKCFLFRGTDTVHVIDFSSPV